MKKIYYVRHGESEANRDRYVAGSELEAPLTDKGKSQAVKAGQDLKDKNIELIVSSPMERTQDTANIIARTIGYDPQKIIVQPLFVELAAGPYSGQSYDLRADHIKKGTLLEGMETADEVHARVTKGLDWLRTLPQNNIVIVSHGGTGRMVRAIIEELPHHEFHKIERMENTEIYEFEL